MAFIIAHHFLIATGSVDYYHAGLRGGEAANAFLACGVDCFILISGYFGIRLSSRKFCRLAYLILFVAATDALLYAAFPSAIGSDDLRYALHKILPFFPDSNWFIPSYFGLMLVSPLLEKAIAASSPRSQATQTAMLAALCLYAYFFHATSINPTGYTLVQLIFLYYLGRTLRYASPLISLPAAAAMYVGGAAAAYLVARFVSTGFTAYAYNSPQILLSSTGLFLAFARLRISNRIVGRAASGMFCVFLFHYLIIRHAAGDASITAIIALYTASFAGGSAISIAAEALWKFCSQIAAKPHKWPLFRAKKHTAK